MIQVRASFPWAEGALPEPSHAAPWRIAPPGPVAFATLWTTGRDPERDGLVRVLALRSGEAGEWQSFSARCRGAGPGSEGARMLREFGLHAEELADAPPADRAIRELHDFLAGHTVITAARGTFLSWWLWVDEAPPLEVLDLAEIAALCLPGRLAGEGERLATSLLGRDPVGGTRALEPADLRAALGILVARALSQPEPFRALLAHSLTAAARALRREGLKRAPAVSLLLALLEHPSAWRDPGRALEPESYHLREGRLSSAADEYPDLQDALDAARPPWKRPASGEGDPPAIRVEEERTLDEGDRRHIDEIFQEHLPRHFARSSGEAPSYRHGQHGVASVIAEGFGRREMRLLHAPTGTGKTLAYLVPTALWAFRNHARVGVATYTRVLQEQAMQRETPLALELLQRAAGVRGIRVAVLKGRENYLCWRALCLQVRIGGDPAMELLAWTSLVLFSLSDDSGDLDRFSRRAPMAEIDAEAYRRCIGRALRSVRSEAGCCTAASDRATCAAEVAWRTAERAHVVITNHALALARRDFFQHLVFDECEHLHDVALNAFSSSVNLRDISSSLARLTADGGGPLERIEALAPGGSEAESHAIEAIGAASRARAALAEFGLECLAYKDWRADRMRERQEADRHSLFREYATESGTTLLASHRELCGSLGELTTSLALLQESLDGALPSRDAPRLRRTLEVLRSELEEHRTAIEVWIPRDAGGCVSFGNETFHDLETTVGGEDVLATRVLLPHEFLGRHYYPLLAGAVLLSATTWIRGGFEATEAYLGLARAAEPAPDEEREGVPVHSFRAPEAFDYGRVLVAVPRDAPPVHDKQAYLEYTARFIAYLAERTRGRVLALFTNAEDLSIVGARLEPFFESTRLPLWWQRMRGATKEELGQLFRAQIDSVLLGLDAFWFGADFPGPTLEYLVVARLPFGVPDRYHHAQCAALGVTEQRRTIYLPRALAKFRQGFGRLMRKESDRGCVFVLDKRIVDPRHRLFLRELPLKGMAKEGHEPDETLARLVAGDSDRCLDEALAHMGMKADVRRRGLVQPFEGWRLGHREE